MLIEFFYFKISFFYFGRIRIGRTGLTRVDTIRPNKIGGYSDSTMLREFGPHRFL